MQEWRPLAGVTPRRDRWIEWIVTHDRVVLLVAALLTVVAALVAAGLRVDTDLRRLLPRDHEVVVNLETIEKTFGSTGSVNVVVKGANAEARHDFTRALAKRLEGHRLLRDVDYRLPSDFFVEHALYYLSKAEMAQLSELIEAWLHFESCSVGDHCLTPGDPEARDRLERFVQDKRNEAADRTGFSDLYERDGIDANVLLLRPLEPAASLDFAHRVTDEMRKEARETYESNANGWVEQGVTYNIVGPYVNKADEHNIIRADVVRAVAFALSGVILVLYLLFRSMRAVIVLLVPLACGVAWSLAAARLVVGDLTLMTSLISTVVMGAGVDAGIHFFVRARRARQSHADREAIREAFRGLVVPLLVASSTTIGAFAIMAMSDFPAFREFGIISAMGVALCLVAMVTVFPALASLIGIKPAKTKARLASSLARIVLARPRVVLSTLVMVSLVAVMGAREIDFEYNGRALQSDHTRHATEADTRLISQIFQRDIHAGVLVRPTLEAARTTLEQSRARRERFLRANISVVAELFAVSDLLPEPEIDLHARAVEIAGLLEEDTLEELEEIAGIPASQRRYSSADEDWDDEGDSVADSSGEDEGRLSKQDAKTLLRMVEAQPFTVEDLPPLLLQTLRSDDGAYGVFAYPAFDAADMKRGVSFTQETRSYVDDGSLFVGETTVYAAMFLMLRHEAPIVLGMAAVLITLLVYWQLRSARQALLTLLPLAVAFVWLIGIMGALDLRFTLFNLPILPAILGIGVDNGVYLTDRIRRTKSEAGGLLKSLEETGGAIMAAMATTAIGFAAFMVADSAGVRGIGVTAVLGIALAGLAATLLLPTIVGAVRNRSEQRG